MSGNDWAFYERHFAEPRLRHYLADSANDSSKAAELYDWNVAVSAAFWEALAYFEVAFRNAIDARMAARHRRLRRIGHWIFDDHHEFGRDALGPGRHRQPFRDVDDARRTLRNRIATTIGSGLRTSRVATTTCWLWPATSIPTYATSSTDRLG